MQCLRLAALVILAGLFSSAWAQTSASVARFYTVAKLPSAVSSNNATVLVTDGANPTDCTTGGGSYGVHCHSNGTTWSALSTVTNNNQLTNGAGFITAAGAPVQSVAGRGGNVTLSHADITDWGTATSGFGGSSNIPTYNVGAGGVTKNTLVTGDLNPNEVVTPTLGGFCGFGVAQATVASGGTVQVMQNGLVQIMTDKAVPVGDIAICSTTTAGYITDSCQTSLNGIPNTTQAIGVVTTASTGPGTLATVRLYDSTKYGTNVSAQAATAAPVQSINGQTGAITNVVQYPLNTFNVAGQAVFGSFNSNGQSYINTTVTGNDPSNSDLYVWNNSATAGAHQLLSLIANNGGSGIDIERSSNAYSNIINLLTGTAGNDVWSIQTLSGSENFHLNYWNGTTSFDALDIDTSANLRTNNLKVQNFNNSSSTYLTIRATGANATAGNTNMMVSIQNSSGSQTAFIRPDGTYGASTYDTLDDATAAIANGAGGGLLLNSSSNVCWSSTANWWNTKETCLDRASANTLAVYLVGTTTPAGFLVGNLQYTSSQAGVSTPAFSATPTFDASLGNMKTLTLTAAVTSSTITNLKKGQRIDFLICQNSTGGYTFAWPTNVHGGMTVGTTANTCSTQSFESWDGTTLYAVTAGVANIP